MLRYSFYMLASLLLLTACKKENLTASSAEDNLLTVKDNPADPTDHAIYQFFQGTGIPCFYNDTLSKKEQVDINGIPRMAYTLMKVRWSPAFGRDTMLQYRLPASKTSVIPMLDLVKNELLPLIPPSFSLRSILFTDLIFIYRDLQFPDRPNLDTMNAYGGFSGLVLTVVDPDTMDAASRKAWAGSAVAAICYKKLTSSSTINLANSFYNISRTAFQNEIYFTEFTSWFPDGSKVPEDFGIIDYSRFYEYILIGSELEDLRSYLDELFSHSSSALSAKYGAYPVTMEKFNVLRTIAENEGFQLPD
jgi:hypothetical protein